MTQYLVFVDTKVPCPEGDATKKLEGFLREAFGQNAYIHEDFGTGPRGLVQLFHIEIDNVSANDEADENVLVQWHYEQESWGPEPIRLSEDNYASEINAELHDHYAP